MMIIAIMKLVVVIYQDKYKTARPFHLSTTAPATATTTTTVRRPLSSIVSNLASEYSVTSIDGDIPSKRIVTSRQDQYMIILLPLSFIKTSTILLL
jgi:hypothetical protein